MRNLQDAEQSIGFNQRTKLHHPSQYAQNRFPNRRNTDKEPATIQFHQTTDNFRFAAVGSNHRHLTCTYQESQPTIGTIEREVG